MLTIVVKANKFVSCDSTILLPCELHLTIDGVIAHHTHHGDLRFDTMSDFADAYWIDEQSIYESSAWDNLFAMEY